MIRSFDWRDFPLLHRYRKHGLWLDSTLELTRWLSFVPAGALLASLAPAIGIYTCVSRANGYPNLPVIGQVVHQPGSQAAQLTFLAPAAAIKSPGAAALLDYLAGQMGRRGAHNLLAEVQENAPAFEVLRQAGYAIYSRQRIWKLAGFPDVEETPTRWSPATSLDEPDIRALYSSIVPALVQQAEPPPWERLNGVVYRHGGELLGYIYLHYGPRGVWAQPFLHPEIENVTGRLVLLLNHLPNRRSRPVYLALRSHPAWLAPPLVDMGARPGPRQAVMAKRLVVPLKAVLPLKIPGTGLETPQPKASAYTLHPITGQPSPPYDETKSYR